MVWTLYTQQEDGRYVVDDSLEMDERDLDPRALIDPHEEMILLADGREVDAMVGEGGLAMIRE